MGSAALLRRPMVASCGTAVVLFGLGDVIAQQVIEKKGKKHDVSGMMGVAVGIHRLVTYGGGSLCVRLE